MHESTRRFELTKTRVMIGFCLEWIVATSRRLFRSVIQFMPICELRCRRYRYSCCCSGNITPPSELLVMPTANPVINQLIPFNAHRFDACMNYLMSEFSSSLSQYDIAKRHVMVDFFHVLETGQQMIGGPLEAWDLGPVVDPGYNRVRSLGYKFEEEKKPVHQGLIRVVGKSQKRYLYAPHGKADYDDFSPAELQAMRRANEMLASKSFKECDAFFHGQTTYMGRLWSEARKSDERIDWGRLVEAYDQETGEDHTHAKLMIDCWRDPQ